jgi:hypothetical protein
MMQKIMEEIVLNPEKKFSTPITPINIHLSNGFSGVFLSPI